MEFLLNHTDLFLGAASSLFVVILPPVNRFLDKSTSSNTVKELFWLIARVEDGHLTEKELQDIFAKLKTYVK